MSKRANVLGFALLVLLLTAGAAQGLDGSNTVFSDDIADGTITAADISPTIKFGCQSSGGPSFATVDTSEATATYSTAPVIAKRNCSGLDVKVKRLGTGAICVKFASNPRTNAVLTMIGTGLDQGAVLDRATTACNGINPAKNGEFQVDIKNHLDAPKDADFTILVF